MIDEADKARRLARAICADVMLYNGTVKDAPIDQRAALISAPVQEGRALFTSRVSPALLQVFEEAVEELVARPLAIAPPAAAPRVVVAPVVSTGKPPSQLDPPMAERGPSLAIVIGVAVLFVILAAAAFLALR
ncbi:MAG: hypothetical protein Q8L48_35780 [Archangium sp.]|nr:hypothetical protein [Archangium sp.]